MTGNVTQIVIDLVDVACGNGSDVVRERIRKFAGPIMAFAVGAISGAQAYLHAGFAALLLPIVVLLWRAQRASIQPVLLRQ